MAKTSKSKKTASALKAQDGVNDTIMVQGIARASLDDIDQEIQNALYEVLIHIPLVLLFVCHSFASFVLLILFITYPTAWGRRFRQSLRDPADPTTWGRRFQRQCRASSTCRNQGAQEARQAGSASRGAQGCTAPLASPTATHIR
jgi:hypothetical protein